MLVYKESNGYPMTLIFETSDAKDEREDWKEGYISVVFDSDQNKISEFFHNELADRALWAKGFYIGLTFKTKE